MELLCAGMAPVGLSSGCTTLSFAALLPWGGCSAVGYLQLYKENPGMQLSQQQSSAPFRSPQSSWGTFPPQKRGKNKSNIAIRITGRGGFQERSIATTDRHGFYRVFIVPTRGTYTRRPRAAEPTALLSLVRAPPLPPWAVAPHLTRLKGG